MRSIYLLITILFTTIGIQAKEMNHRLGVGPKYPFSEAAPALAVHYFPNGDYAVTGALAIRTNQGSSQFGLQGGLRRTLFEERNMNFFVGGNFGIISFEAGGENQSGFELMALAGGEFFLEGLENLGFNFELGVGVTSVKSSNSFSTLARGPAQAGIIFYF